MNRARHSVMAVAALTAGLVIGAGGGASATTAQGDCTTDSTCGFSDFDGRGAETIQYPSRSFWECRQFGFPVQSAVSSLAQIAWQNPDCTGSSQQFGTRLTNI